MHELMRGSWYLLDGINAEPWTAPSVSHGRRGGAVTTTVYKNEQLRSFQEAVGEAMERQYPDAPKLEGAIELEFYIWRQQAVYQGRRGKVQKHQVDATNLQKALEDALQGYLYGNDREVHAIKTTVMAQGPDVTPRILIGVHTLAGLPQWPTDKLNHMLRSQAVERHPSGDHSVETPEDFF